MSGQTLHNQTRQSCFSLFCAFSHANLELFQSCKNLHHCLNYNSLFINFDQIKLKAFLNYTTDLNQFRLFSLFCSFQVQSLFEFSVKMKARSKRNFQDLCSFNCAITKFFGYFYFTANQNREKNDERKMRDFIEFAFYVTFGLIASIKSSGISIGLSTSSIIISIGVDTLIQLTFYMPTIFRVVNFVVRHKHVKIIKNIQSIDSELLRIGININYMKHFIVAVSVTLIYCSFLLLTLSVDILLSRKYLKKFVTAEPLSAALAVFSIAAYLNYQISHMLIVSTIYKRFQHINSIIENSPLDYLLMKKIGKLFNKLSDTQDLVNSCYAINLLNYFFQFFVYNIFFFFGLFHYLTSPDAAFTELIFNIISGFYLVYFFWFGAWMITVSSWIKSEGCKMKILIHSQSMTTSKDLKAFANICLQLNHQKPVISCGLFIVDWSFLFIFVGSLFSYLIILVQFETD